MTKSRKGFGDLISVILITVLFLVILILVVFSAVSYQRSVDIQDRNNNTRAVLSYVTTAVRANAGNRVTLTERGGVPVLVIEEGESGYEQQIFWMDGQVLERYVPDGTLPEQTDALTIGTAGLFEMTMPKEDLLQIRTDQGTSYVHIRE